MAIVGRGGARWDVGVLIVDFVQSEETTMLKYILLCNHTRQCDCSEEQADEHEVRKDRGDVSSCK